MRPTISILIRLCPLVMLLLSGASNFPAGATVTVDHHPREASTSEAIFDHVPLPPPMNAATNAEFTVVDGSPNDTQGGLACLHDGRLASGEDAPTQNFFFAWATLEGRLRLDLKRAVPIARISTFSWHKGSRAPQIYKVFGSDGAARNFQPSPHIGTDPASCGWTLIAKVDTRPASGPPGGQYAVGITDPGGIIGPYRFLLFEMFATETDDPWGHTFYSEICVTER